MVTYQAHEVVSHALTPEGAQIASEGSHEARVWHVLPGKGEGTSISPVELKKLVGDETAKIGQGRAFKNGWIGKEDNGLVRLVRSYNNTNTRTKRACVLINDTGPSDMGCNEK